MGEDGIDLGGYTIPEVVEDLEDARMALGYEHVNLLSESYGTRVAQVYAAAHADRVARSAMIGVNPPGRFVWEPALIDQQLRYYAELYQKASAGRQTTPNLAEMMHDVVRNLPERWDRFDSTAARSGS